MIESSRPDVNPQDVKIVARGGIVTLFGSLFGRGIDLLLMVMLARILGPYEYGLYAIGLNVLRIIGLIAPLGLDRGVVRFGSRPNVSKYWTIRTSLKLALLFGMFFGGVVFVVSPWLATQFGEPQLVNILRTFAFAIPFFGGLMVAVGATTLSKKMHFTVMSRDIVQPLANLILVGAFAIVGVNALYAAVAVNVSFALGFASALYFVSTLFRDVEKDNRVSPDSTQNMRAKELVRFSFFATLAGVVVNLTNRTDRLMVGYLLSAESAGIYQAAAQSATLFLVVMGALNGIFIPMIAELHESKQYKRLDQLYKLVTRWTLYVSIPISLTFCFAASALMEIVYGEVYTVGAIVLILTALAQLINAGTGAVGPILIMSGNQIPWAMLAFCALVSNVVLNWLVIPQYGLFGAGIVSLLTISILYALGILYARYKLDVWPYSRKYLKGLISALCTVAILFLAGTWTRVVSAEVHFASTLILAVTVFTTLLFIQGFEAEDIQLFEMIRQRVRVNRNASL